MLEAGCRTHSFPFFINQPACSTAAVSTARMMLSNSVKSSFGIFLAWVGLYIKDANPLAFLIEPAFQWRVVFLSFDIDDEPAILLCLERDLAVCGGTC